MNKETFNSFKNVPQLGWNGEPTFSLRTYTSWREAPSLQSAVQRNSMQMKDVGGGSNLTVRKNAVRPNSQKIDNDLRDCSQPLTSIYMESRGYGGSISRKTGRNYMTFSADGCQAFSHLLKVAATFNRFKVYPRLQWLTWRNECSKEGEQPLGEGVTVGSVAHNIKFKKRNST